MRLPAVRKSQALISRWNFDSNTAILLKMKFVPKLWEESADQIHVNNRSRLVSAAGADYWNGSQTSNVWRRNMTCSRESRPRGSRKQQTKITFAAHARTLNRFLKKLSWGTGIRSLSSFSLDTSDGKSDVSDKKQTRSQNLMITGTHPTIPLTRWRWQVYVPPTKPSITNI